MRILSFAWTWPAFVAGFKTVTRRLWKPAYAVRWKAGTSFRAYNRSPRFGGQAIGTGRLTLDVLLEPLTDMPDEDYDREGFRWLLDHPQTLPNSARQQRWADCTWESFLAWKSDALWLYVIRYEILTIEDWARDELAKLLKDDALVARETPS